MENACYNDGIYFCLGVHHFLKPGQIHGTLLYMYVQASRLVMLALMYQYR
jgi:hypothetical protein